MARTPALLRAACERTPAFVRGTTALSRPRPPREVRDAFAAPYATAARRSAVADFVADIPLEDDHPSMPALRAIADGVRSLDVPVLLAWGPADPVFSDRYLRDLLDRLPHADAHRYEGASHLVTEDAPAVLRRPVAAGSRGWGRPPPRAAAPVAGGRAPADGGRPRRARCGPASPPAGRPSSSSGRRDAR